MSSAHQNITKGIYKHPQIENFISVKDYLFLRENGEKYLLIRYVNDGDFTVEGMDLTLFQLATDGTELDSRTVSYRNLKIKPGQTYTAKLGIAVDNLCTDFRVCFTHLTSGQYDYLVQGRQVTVQYREPQADVTVVPSGKGKAIAELNVHPIRQKKKGLSVLFGILVVLALLALTFFRILQPFVSPEESTAPPENIAQTGFSVSCP